MNNSRFDEYFVGKDAEFITNCGLVPMNEDEAQQELLAMNAALPISLIWADRDNNEKYISWDSELEQYLQHFGRVIDQAGRESYEPLSIYNEMGLNWLDGFATSQNSLGSCCLFGHEHAGRCTALAMAKMKGNVKPEEINASITYSIARGNGRISWGSGLNLQPMSQWAARIGNQLTSDVGRYDVRGGNVNTAMQQKAAAGALRNQSIPCYLPNLSFDTFYELARAGIAANIGSTTWPSGAVVDSNGISVGQGISRGAHATMVGGFAIEINGTRYVYWQNSHGPRYKVGTRIKQSAFGCFLTPQTWNLLAIDNRFGRSYANFLEICSV